MAAFGRKYPRSGRAPGRARGGIRRGGNKPRKMWRAKVARVAKGVALRNLETKNLTVDIGLATIYKDGGDVISNSTPWSSYPLRNISIGTGAVDVIGDEVTLKQFNIHLMLRNASATSLNSHFRVMVGWFLPNVTSIGNNWRIGTGGDATSAFIRTPNDQLTIWKKLIHDRVYPVDSLISGVTAMRDVRINLKMHNKKYTFDPSSKFGTKDDLVILVTASTPTGTPLTNPAGSIDGYYRVWYKDG